MFEWGAIILAVLKLINLVVSWAQARGYIKQGYDQAIAEQTREVFRKTEYARRVMEKVDAMSDDEVDAALVALEPAGPVPVQRGGAPPVRG